MSRNEIRYDNRSMHADGCGDGGERFLMTGLPGWLRDRIESVAIPADRDLYFRDVVTALAGRGWDSLRITIAIAGPVWIPDAVTTSQASRSAPLPKITAHGSGQTHPA